MSGVYDERVTNCSGEGVAVPERRNPIGDNVFLARWGVVLGCWRQR
jgi:hypothetical protein